MFGKTESKKLLTSQRLFIFITQLKIEHMFRQGYKPCPSIHKPRRSGELLKDPTMLRRLNDIAKFPDEDKSCILYTLDAMINNVKLRGLNVN